MAETPEERLARLRREVESTWTPPGAPAPVPAAAPPPAATRGGASDPAAAPAVVTAPEPAARPTPAPSATLPASSIPAPVAPLAAPHTGGDAWSLGDALGGAGFSTWIAIGLVVVGAYLLIALVVPGIELPGSLAMAAVGVVVLWLHLTHRLGSWALYAGAVLFAIGALRVIGDLVLVTINGETSLGLGLALLAIGYLRHQQAGGYGWQGMVGAVASGWGVIQLLLGLLPGSPGLLDLVLPVLLLGGGVLLLLRTARTRI